MHEQLSQWWEGVSLRSKITGVTVLVVTVGLLVVGMGTLTVLQQTLVGEVDRQLREAASELPQSPDQLSLDDFDDFSDLTGSVFSSPFYFAAVGESGEVLVDNVDPSQSLEAPDVSSLGFDVVRGHFGEGVTLTSIDRTTQWRLAPFSLTLRDDDGAGSMRATLVIGANLAESNAIIGSFASIFLGFGLVAVIVSAGLTRLLVTSTFRPLRDVEATAARFAGGDFSQRLGGATPNTEVGRLSRSLNTMLSRIDRAFADRAATIDQMRRFVGDASHELRTPLVSLRGYAELYRMGAIQKPDDVAQAMERIEKEAIRMGALVHDLLELARLDESKPLEAVPVDLVPLARDAALDAMAGAPDREVTVVDDEGSASAAPMGHQDVAALVERTPERLGSRRSPRTTPRAPARAEAAASGESTTSSLSIAAIAAIARLRGRRARATTATAPVLELAIPEVPSFEAVVLGDENKIRQVVTNLVGNAMRFTPTGSPIELAVAVDRPRGMGTISVVDHGEGIPAALKEKIFQRFFRADSSRTRDTGGSGLGLAIVASIVAQHGGRVDVIDTPGGGATFVVSLPLLPKPHRAAHSALGGDGAPTPASAT